MCYKCNPLGFKVCRIKLSTCNWQSNWFEGKRLISRHQDGSYAWFAFKIQGFHVRFLFFGQPVFWLILKRKIWANPAIVWLSGWFLVVCLYTMCLLVQRNKHTTSNWVQNVKLLKRPQLQLVSFSPRNSGIILEEFGRHFFGAISSNLQDLQKISSFFCKKTSQKPGMINICG